MPQSYSIISFATLFLASACIVLFCFIVDPYKLFPTIPGLSQQTSVDLFYKLRLHKPYAIEEVKPSILILGSSRAAALPPRAVQSIDGVAYNASLAGGTLQEARLMAEHAHAISPLKLIVIGVDYAMFREGASETMVLNEPHRYRSVDPGLRQHLQHRSQRIGDHWRSLFSVDAIMDSLRLSFGTVRSQREYREDGTWDLSQNTLVPAYQRYARLTHLVFNAEIAHKSDRLVLDELLDLLDFTDAHGIKVIVLISPLQGLLMHSLELAGTWDQYLLWQRDLVESITARKTDSEIYGLEDNPLLVLEAIETPQRLFRDGVHYTLRAGTEILTCLSGPCNSSLQPTRLDGDTINDYLEKVDALRLQYKQENPQDIAEAHRWLSPGTKKKDSQRTPTPHLLRKIH